MHGQPFRQQRLHRGGSELQITLQSRTEAQLLVVPRRDLGALPQLAVQIATHQDRVHRAERRWVPMAGPGPSAATNGAGVMKDSPFALARSPPPWCVRRVTTPESRPADSVSPLWFGAQGVKRRGNVQSKTSA